MFHPFAPLSSPLLDAFIKAGKTYFVRQTYSRCKTTIEDEIKGHFIFTHYAEIGHAQHHLGAISEDPHRFMYQWHNPDHQQKLKIAAGMPAGYQVYSSVFEKNWQKRITMSLKDNVKKFIDHTLGWTPGRGEIVGFEIYVNYGELYAKLKLRTQEVRIKLEVIENL